MTEITGCSPSLLAFDASVTFPVHALNVSWQELATCVGVPRLAPATSRYMLLKPRRDRSLKGGFGVSGMTWHLSLSSVPLSVAVRVGAGPSRVLRVRV